MGEYNKRIVLIALFEIDSPAVRILHPILRNKGYEPYSIFLKRREHNRTLRYPSKKEMVMLKNTVKKINPLFVGITVRSTLFKLSAHITKMIKQEVNCPVVWGGIHPTSAPEQSIRYTDIICRGEGEDAIVELAERLSNNEDISNIQNLWVRKNEGTTRNELRPLIQNLDNLPFPDYTDKNKIYIDNNTVKTGLSNAEWTLYPILTTRGCFYTCSFCCNSVLKPLYKNKGGFVRRRSPENVIGELKLAKQRFPNLSHISFADEVFAYDYDWLERFSKLYKKYIKIPFSCDVHPNITKEKHIKILREAGLISSFLGIQTGSENFNKNHYSRYVKNKDFLRLAHAFKKYNIEFYVELIMDNPLETEHEKCRTLELLLAMPRPFRLKTISLAYFRNLPLTNKLLENGSIGEEDLEDQKEKGYSRWSPLLDLRRDPHNLFWENLFYLSSKRILPKKFIYRLRKNKFLKKNPWILTRILRWTTDDRTSIRNGSFVDRVRFYLVVKMKYITKNIMDGTSMFAVKRKQ